MTRDMNYEKFPICSTNTGFFGGGCCENIEKSDIEGELGLGISIYFKQLKVLIIFCFLCTLVSIPAYFIFATGEQLGSREAVRTSGLSNFFTRFSLGNVGENQQNWVFVKQNQSDVKVPLACLAGTMNKVPTDYGIGAVKASDQDGKFEID